MNADVKQKWVAALRSGEYKQAKEVLRNENSYCCLGVLCDLHSPNAWRPNQGASHYTHGENSIWGTYPDNEIKAWAGVETRAMSELAEMNDNGDTFAQIANWIEANL